MEVKNKYESKDWDTTYTSEIKSHIKPKGGFFLSYDIFLCDAILQKYLPASFNTSVSSHKLKLCEIGCGDGRLVRKIADMFGYEPYGIEYSEVACEIAKSNNIEVIMGDIFDENILSKYKNYFDIVFSYGFIEHIHPVEKAIEIHLSLLKSGGYFFIQIPRLKGFNYWKVRFFRPNLLPNHNLEIMEEEKLRSIVSRQEVEEIFCKSYGTFKIRVPMDKKNIRYYLLKVLSSVEYILNPLFRLLFSKKGWETKIFSPSVMFIGRKKHYPA